MHQLKDFLKDYVLTVTNIRLKLDTDIIESLLMPNIFLEKININWMMSYSNYINNAY